MADMATPRPNQPRGPTSEQVGSDARRALTVKYASKTNATILSGEEFDEIRNRDGLHVVGVTGFSGQWGKSKIDSDPAVRANVDAAIVALERHLVALKNAHGGKLILSSGATMEGVPKIIYDLCEKHGIAAMGVTCEKALNYQLGTMKYLIIEGQEWGSESATFLRTSDEIVVLGGGGQAKREAIAAGQAGKKISLFRGYGGSADEISPSEVPGATFILR